MLTFGPSITPPPILTLPPVATPTSGATAAQTATLTAEPTETPTEAPAASPTPEPSEALTESLSPQTVIFDDAMEDPASGWATGESELTTVSYVGSALRFVHNTDSGGSYSPRQFGGNYRTIFSGRFFQPAGQGGMGLLCGTPGGTSCGALFTTSGSLVFLSISGAEIAVLQRHDHPGVKIPVDAE